MPEQFPSLEGTYYRDVTRILSDIALINAGARFENGILLMPSNHIAQLILENPATEQAIPNNLLPPEPNNVSGNTAPWDADEKLQEAKTMLRAAYRAQRLAETIEHLDPTKPAMYIQSIRDFIQQSRDDASATDIYELDDPAVARQISGDTQIISHDIAHILPHRDLELYPDHWREIIDGKRLPYWFASQNPAEDGFINHALGIYGITARMALHAQQYGLRDANSQISMHTLPESQRYHILRTALTEWQTFVVNLPSDTLAVKMRTKRPLLYRSNNDLQHAYESYPQIDRARIASIFISHPRAVFDQLPAIATRIDTIALQDPELSTFTSRELEFRDLAKAALSKENQLMFSDSLAPGEIIYTDDISNIDEIVFSTLARLDAHATQLYGEPLGNVWRSGTINKLTTERLVPRKFYGKLENPRIVILPTDDEFIETYLRPIENPEQVDRDSIIRLNGIVDMRSTGRGIVGHSLVDIILYTRNISDVYRRWHILSIRGVASGEQVAKRLATESSDNAKSILEYALKHPYSGGLINPR